MIEKKVKKSPRKASYIYGRLLKFTTKYWVIFLIGAVATLLLSATDALFTWAIKPIINQGIIDKDPAFIRLLPFLIILILVIRGVSSFASNYFITRMARNVVMDFRQKIFAHLMYLPATFYDRYSSGRLLSTIIYNVDQVAQASSDTLLTILRESTLLIGLLTVMLIVSWQLTLVFLIVAPFISWIMRVCSRRLRHLSKNVQDAVGDVTHVAEEAIEGYKVVRLYGGIKHEVEKFNNATRLNRHREMKVAVTTSLGSALTQILIGIPIALLLLLATVPSLHITAGSLAAMATAVLTMLRPVRRLTNVNSFIQKGLAAVESIFVLLDTEQEKDRGICSITKAEGNIQYENITLQYIGTKKPALKNVSLKIEPGEVIAIVGRSGSGKSTLISLLPRFYDLNKGKILIDGIDVREYKLKELRQQFAIVSQQTTLFNDTIRHNIAYGQNSKRMNEKAIIKAAQAAYAMEFIQHLPEGLETIVGENGVLLSGGQRQRLAIARAILRNSPILILDEATASLDTHAEREIQAALKNLMVNRTTLIIAHRLSTVEHADRILVFEKGELIEQGNHQELLKKGGTYTKLYRLQFPD